MSVHYESVKDIKADNGYKGKLTEIIKETLSIEELCGKSNYGTSEFIPWEGQWVVERTIIMGQGLNVGYGLCMPEFFM